MLQRKLIEIACKRIGLFFHFFICCSFLKAQTSTPQSSLAGNTGSIVSFKLVSIDSLMALSETAQKAAHPEKIKEEAPKISLHPKAKRFVEAFIISNEDALEKIKISSVPYFKIIESVLQKNDLPVELKYLAVIESGLKVNALSPAGAVGPWQLMPATARLFGLRVKGKTDERKNYYKSTAAAAKYLTSLYKEFDDWLLVIAAYNGGPGSVYKAIKKTGSRNFWRLQYALPEETRMHVKRFIGAHYFFENKGSATTVSRDEINAFKEKMNVYLKRQVAETQEVYLDAEAANVPL